MRFSCLLQRMPLHEGRLQCTRGAVYDGCSARGVGCSARGVQCTRGAVHERCVHEGVCSSCSCCQSWRHQQYVTFVDVKFGSNDDMKALFIVLICADMCEYASIALVVYESIALAPTFCCLTTRNTALTCTVTLKESNVGTHGLTRHGIFSEMFWLMTLNTAQNTL